MHGLKKERILYQGMFSFDLDASVLSEHCEKEKIKLELIENADHSLEIPENASENIDILKHIVKLY
ncbi:MAG: hypothetical protein FWD01_05460 [Defluviitaleaceae bacterium]|nr:hypothetical protein [Defluviitaleaceae bacterium]